eukprot:g59323.t1
MVRYTITCNARQQSCTLANSSLNQISAKWKAVQTFTELAGPPSIQGECHVQKPLCAEPQKPRDKVPGGATPLTRFRESGGFGDLAAKPFEKQGDVNGSRGLSGLSVSISGHMKFHMTPNTQGQTKKDREQKSAYHTNRKRCLLPSMGKDLEDFGWAETRGGCRAVPPVLCPRILFIFCCYARVVVFSPPTSNFIFLDLARVWELSGNTLALCIDIMGNLFDCEAYHIYEKEAVDVDIPCSTTPKPVFHLKGFQVKKEWEGFTTTPSLYSKLEQERAARVIIRAWRNYNMRTRSRMASELALGMKQIDAAQLLLRNLRYSRIRRKFLRLITELKRKRAEEARIQSLLSLMSAETLDFSCSESESGECSDDNEERSGDENKDNKHRRKRSRSRQSPQGKWAKAKILPNHSTLKKTFGSGPVLDTQVHVKGVVKASSWPHHMSCMDVAALPYAAPTTPQEGC